MSSRRADEFRDPFGDLEAEPVTDYQIGAVSPASGSPAEHRGRAVVQRGGYVRLTPVRPAERRRKSRKLTVTFSDSRTVQRLRALAEKWEVRAPNGEPNVSFVVEHLLSLVLEDAESGAISPPRFRNGTRKAKKGAEWWV